jgi:dihydrofolate reductase
VHHDISERSGSGSVYYYFAQSVDGYLADSDGGLDWLFHPTGRGGVPDAVEDPGAYERFFAGVGALAMGSRTYLSIRDGGRHEQWPYGATPSWVFTSRALRPWPGADIRFVDGAIRPVWEQMRQAAGDRDLWLVGGGDLASRFAAEGLLHQLDISVIPMILGSGVPAFTRSLAQALTLTKAEALTDGSVRLNYALTDVVEPS